MGKPIELEVKESFVGFIEVKSQASSDLENTVVEVIENVTNLSKLRGQGYDGAANMSGVYTELQARLKRRNPAARYIHCCAHSLNLVINDAVRGI